MELKQEALLRPEWSFIFTVGTNLVVISAWCTQTKAPLANSAPAVMKYFSSGSTSGVFNKTAWKIMETCRSSGLASIRILVSLSVMVVHFVHSTHSKNRVESTASAFIGGRP